MGETRKSCTTGRHCNNLILGGVALFAAIVGVGLYVGLIRQGGEQQSADVLQPHLEEKESADLDERRRREEECILWLMDHKVIDNCFYAFDPFRVTDKFEWHKDYMGILGIAHLSDSSIRDEDLHYVLMLPSLSWIYLNTDTTKLSAEGLRQLANHPALAMVSFQGNSEVPKDWVKSLASGPSIQMLSFECPVTDDIPVILDESRSKVCILAFMKATTLTEKGYQAIGNIPSLESLMVYSQKPLGDEEIRHIVRHKKLKELFIGVDANLHLSLQLAKDIASMPSLEDLFIGSTSDFSTEVLGAFGRRSWKYLCIDSPAFRAKAEKEGKPVFDVSRKLVREAASAVSDNEEGISIPASDTSQETNSSNNAGKK